MLIGLVPANYKEEADLMGHIKQSTTTTTATTTEATTKATTNRYKFR